MNLEAKKAVIKKLISQMEDEMSERLKPGEGDEAGLSVMKIEAKPKLMESEESEDEESEDEEEMEDEEEETAGDDTKIVDITLGDLVDAIKAAMGGQSEMSDMETSEDETISLDEILAELDEEEEFFSADIMYHWD